MTHNWKQFFPYPQTRKEQEDAINFALDAFIEQDKKFVVIEAGTGVGKSAIAIASANYLSERRCSCFAAACGTYDSPTHHA